MLGGQCPPPPTSTGWSKNWLFLNFELILFFLVKMMSNHPRKNISPKYQYLVTPLIVGIMADDVVGYIPLNLANSFN